MTLIPCTIVQLVVFKDIIIVNTRDYKIPIPPTILGSKITLLYKDTQKETSYNKLYYLPILSPSKSPKL